MVPNTTSTDVIGRRPAPDFLGFLPQVERHARRAFRCLQGQDRDDAIAEAVAHAFVSFTTLIRRGIDPTRFPGLMVRYAVSHVWDGRQVGGRQSSKDVLNRRARRLKGFHVGLLSDEALIDPRTPVPDQVAVRMDFTEFLESLPERHRAMALALAEGVSATEVARQFGVSSSRVTQIRKAWLARWLNLDAEHSTTDACRGGC